jgi:hypothetical protein
MQTASEMSSEPVLKTPLTPQGTKRKFTQALRYCYMRFIWHTYKRIALHLHGSSLPNFGEGSLGRPKVVGAGIAVLKVGKYCSISNSATFVLGLEHRPEWLTSTRLAQLAKNTTNTLIRSKAKAT